MARPRILLVGIDPRVMDYAAGPLAGFTAESVLHVLEEARAQVTRHDIAADLCLIDLGATAETALSAQLAGAHYDCIVIGAGVRVPAERLLLFETVVNLVHRLAPTSSIAFNTNPADSLAAALRWLPRDR